MSNGIAYPEPSEVLDSGASVLAAIYQSLESGTERMREFFEREQSLIDRSLAPSLVRFHARRFLDDRGHEVSDEMVPYERDDLLNNGLSVRHLGYTFRILKADQDRIPSPGHSLAKVAFFNQQLPLFLGSLVSSEGPVRPNLLVIWYVSPSYVLTKIAIACPKSASIRRKNVSVYWLATVPHPASLMGSESPPSVDYEIDIELESDDDSASNVG